jgi:FkbH-like protein
MFEFDKFETTTRPGAPAAAPQRPTIPIRAEKSALLLWGEHCIECAAPDCFRSCDLYVPRPDGRCRRFDGGTVPNQAFAGRRGAAAEVTFRKWGKLEARGNARLFADTTVGSLERWSQRLIRVADRLGSGLARVLRDERWRYAGFALFERINTALHRRGLRETPDGFLIEAYNPSGAPIRFVLTMSVDRSKLPQQLSADELPRPFALRLELPPGPFRKLIPYAECRDIIECRLAFNISIVPEAEEGTHVVFRTLDFVKLSPADQASLTESPPPSLAPVRVATSPPKRAAAAKCVVFDLDNTLWGGTLVESDAVALKTVVPNLLKALDERGILMSVASKNSHSHALAKLQSLGLDEYFLYPRINWGPKSDSVRGIATDLDIGLDTFVFIDDNPFELSEVSSALPAVECLDAAELSRLLEHPRLQGSTSQEARSRRRMYREAIVREEVETSFSGDYTDFLRSCGIRVTIRPNEAADLERVSELVQRTNQLNFSGRKYTRDEVTAMLADPAVERYVLACEDKFGSYGTVGFCVARRSGSEVRIEDLMLSCRVQGKLIEAALFGFVAGRGAQPAERIVVNFRKTDRNMPAQNVLRKLGFDLDRSEVAMAVDPGTFYVDYLDVVAG